MNKKGFLLIAIPIVLIVLVIISVVISLGGQIKTVSVYNDNCLLESDHNYAGYQDDDYSIICYYDNNGQLEKKDISLFVSLMAPFHVITGNSCGSGFGSKGTKDFSSDGTVIGHTRCTIIPMWKNV